MSKEVSFEKPCTCVIIPSTFSPGIDSTFSLSVLGESVDISPLTRDWNRREFHGEWKAVTAGGRILPDNKWKNNPHFSFSATEGMKISVVLHQSEKEKPIGIGIYLFRQDKGEEGLLTQQQESLFLPWPKVDSCQQEKVIKLFELTTVTLQADIEEGDYCLIPCTFEPDKEDQFSIELFTNKLVE